MDLLLRQTRELSFETSGGPPLEFRIEVFERSSAEAMQSRFKVRVWVHELVRLSSPFNKEVEGGHFDATVLVLSDLFDGLEYAVETPDEAAEACIARIRKQLTVR